MEGERDSGALDAAISAFLPFVEMGSHYVDQAASHSYQSPCILHARITGVH